jgi:hypothetical protein
MKREIQAYAIYAHDGGWVRPEQVGNHDVCVIVTKRQLGAYLFSFEEDARATLAELTGVVESQWNYDMRFEEGDLRIVPVIFSYDDDQTVIS